MKTSYTLLLSVAVWAAAGSRAEAQNYWDSGPAVIAEAVYSPGGVHDSTVIFARSGNMFHTLARQGQNTVWKFGTSEEISLTVPGGYDSDPAATYLPSGKIMICGHQAASPGHFYCAIGEVNYLSGTAQSPILFPVSPDPAPAGGGTFWPWETPAIVLVESTVYLFGRGMDSQIWYATADISTGIPVWDGWWYLPGAGNFATGPAAVAFDDNGIEVCARTNSIMFCNKRSPSGGWSGWFSIPPDKYVASDHHLAMTRSADAIWLVGRSYVDPDSAFASWSYDGVNWEGPFQLGGGCCFSSAAAAASAPGSTNVLTVARGGDSRLWFNIAWEWEWTAIVPQ